MADIFPPEKRSEIMRKIKPRGSKQEIFIRKLVHSMGYRYRLHKKDLPGTPDLVFPKYKKVIFVHGCFWHGHEGCKRSALPTTNVEFWKKKISGNVKRDKSNYQRLEQLGWKYMTVWQCEIKESQKEKLKRTISNFLEMNNTLA
jgi:DNA mismatch endonuclease (patch repair protein)